MSFLTIPILVGIAKAQGRYELNVSAYYSTPLLEAYGSNVSFDITTERVSIDGKNVVNSDNFGTKYGFGVQVYGNMRLFKSNIIKAIGNIGYSQMESKYPSPDGYDYGVRLIIFSLGVGLQINPIGIHRFYPSLIGLFRYNEVGGETFHRAGVDFLKASPRFGYSSGISLNYKFNKKVGMSFAVFYYYDNWLNKESNDNNTVIDPYGHVVNFNDMKGETNGLAHDRRIAYVSTQLGINIYFK